MRNGVVVFLTLGLALAALIVCSVAMMRVNQLERMLEETHADVCINSDEAMRSIADSFKMNRLDYSITWTTPEGSNVLAGAFK